MRRDAGKKFARGAEEKNWRKAELIRTGVDPVGEAELHERVAALKLLDLTREAAEAEKAARAAEAAAAAEEEAAAAAAPAPEGLAGNPGDA